jgi:proteasome accessory factor A
VATLLKVGSLQIVLAMIEQGKIDPTLALEDPVEAIRLWSHDARLELALPLTDGTPVRAVELQLRLLDLAERFVAAGRCRGLVPRAAEIVALWRDTVEKLAVGDLSALTPRLDWVLKLALLGRAVSILPVRGWESPELKHLDFLYASLAPEHGLYWAMERAGQVEPVVTAAAVERLTTQPPRDTRALARAELLRRAPAEAVVAVDWDRIRFELPADPTGLRSFTVRLGDPRRSERRQIAAAAARSESFAELLAALGEPTPPTRTPLERTALARRTAATTISEGDRHALPRTSV